MSQVENVLRLEHVTMQFGGVVAVNDLSLEVNQGEIVALTAPTAPARPLPSTASPECMSPPTGGSPFWENP